MFDELKFALQFPQGQILFVENMTAEDISAIDPYFKPNNSMDAFLIYGMKQELFGKTALTVKAEKEIGADPYYLVYEFSAKDGALSDARIIRWKQPTFGTLVDETIHQELQSAINNGTLALLKLRDTALRRVYNAASFPDGQRGVIELTNGEVFIGTPGNYTKVETRKVLTSDRERHVFLTDDGDTIDFPRSHLTPKFNDIELAYMDASIVTRNDSSSKVGLDPTGGRPRLTPVSDAVKP